MSSFITDIISDITYLPGNEVYTIALSPNPKESSEKNKIHLVTNQK